MYAYTMMSGALRIATILYIILCFPSSCPTFSFKKCFEAYERFQHPTSIAKIETEMGIYNMVDCTVMKFRMNRSPTIGNPDTISEIVSVYGISGGSVNEIVPYLNGTSPKTE